MDTTAIYQTPTADLIDPAKQDPLVAERALLVARRQKLLIYTFLLYLFLSLSIGALNADIRPLFQLMVIPTFIAIIIFNARLCWVVYGRFTAVILSIFGIIPVLNFFIIAAANSRATRLIRKAGFKVGFMGCNLKKMREAEE